MDRQFYVVNYRTYGAACCVLHNAYDFRSCDNQIPKAYGGLEKCQVQSVLGHACWIEG